MNILQTLLQVLGPLLKPVSVEAEKAAIQELQAIVKNVSSPDLQQLLTLLVSALDQFAQEEIGKLP